MADPFVYERQSRRPATIAIVGIAVLFLFVLIFGLSAHPAIVAIFSVLTGPAVWEVWRNSVHRLVIDDTHIGWESGSRMMRLALDDILEVRTRTAFDLSQRATLYGEDGKRWRIPMPCLPPGKEIDAQLETRGVKVTRTIFGS